MPRSSASIGREGEKVAAEFFQEIDPSCERVKRPDYGISDMDLTMIDCGRVKLLAEVKTDKSLWSRRYQAGLEDCGVEGIKVRGPEWSVVVMWGDTFKAMFTENFSPPRIFKSARSWHKGVAAAVEQADGYTENLREDKPVIPLALFQLRQGPGRPWAKMIAMDAEYFRDLILSLLKEDE